MFLDFAFPTLFGAVAALAEGAHGVFTSILNNKGLCNLHLRTLNVSQFLSLVDICCSILSFNVSDGSQGASSWMSLALHSSPAAGSVSGPGPR